MSSNKIFAKWPQLLLVLAALFWGSAMVVTKDTLETLSTFWILTFRFSGAALFMTIISLKKLKLINMEYIKNGSLMGIFLFLTYGLQTTGLNFTTPGKNAFLVVIYCVAVPFLYWAIEKKRPDKYNIIAGILFFVGIGFISLSGESGVNFGDFLTILGGLSFAVHITIVPRCVKGKDIFLMTIVQFVFFAIFSLATALIFEEIPKAVPLSASLSILYLIIFSTCIGFIFQNIGQKHTKPATASLLIALEAPFAVAISIISGFDNLTLATAFGFTLIFIAIICSETKFKFKS